MKKLIVLIIAGSGLYLSLFYHIILLDNSIKFLKKTNITFEDCFVDARGMNKTKLLLKPHLIEAGLKDLF